MRGIQLEGRSGLGGREWRREASSSLSVEGMREFAGLGWVDPGIAAA